MAVSEMIVRNIGGITDPEEVKLMTRYVSYVTSLCRPLMNRSKYWHDCIFNPRYYYTTCQITLEILSHIHTKEMARHVIYLHSDVVPFSSMYVIEVETLVRRILDAGLCVVYHDDEDSFIMKSSNEVFKAKSIEMILEGIPFQEEYVTNLKDFNKWLDARLPTIKVVK
jgi:hypothetical protein